MRRRTRLLILCLFVAATPACAVPIPWKNCGKPTDLLSITQANASVWPPTVAAPANATATFDAAGNLVNLRLFLLNGIAWWFDSGPLPATTSAGFVSLPASFPMTVTSPALPLGAGPYVTTHTFGGRTALPVTIVERANVAMDVNAPVTVTVGLSFDGAPGFPLAPVAGSAYAVHVQMTEPGGAEVFCMDLIEPLKSAAPFVIIQRPSAVAIPTLAPDGLAVVAVMICAIALLGKRRRGA